MTVNLTPQNTRFPRSGGGFGLSYDPNAGMQSLIIPLISSSLSLLLPLVKQAGLYWEDMIEPVDSTYWPLASGKRIWYVDLDAAINGNGDELTPFNNFTDLVGYWDGVNYQQGTAGFAGGDQIWVKGTAIPAKHSNGITNMNIHIRRAAQLGTASAPTVIRAWKGYTATFDGNYAEEIGIYAGLTSGTTAGLVVFNVEVKGCTQPGIYIDDYIAYVRIVSCYAHHNYALNGGPLESYGGIRVRNSRTGQDVAVYNNKTERNNTSNGVDTQASNNIGGISLLCQNNGANTSVVKFYQNDCQNENYAIRHKHSGNCDFESYGNYIANSNIGHYIRNAAGNNLHDNIISGCPIETELVSENQSARRSLTYTDNQLTNVDKIITTAAQAETLGNDVAWSGNTYTNSTYTGPVIVMGQYSSSASSLSDVTGSGNIIAKNGSDFAMENGTAVNLASYASTTGDTTTTQVAP